MDIFLFSIAMFFAIKYLYDKYDAKNAKTEQQDTTEQPPSVNQVDLTTCYQRKNLLTKTEYVFYGILKKKCDAANLLICPKVRLEDFILVTAKEKMKYRGYIKSRHVDFLICDASLHILAAIELDDPSHLSQKAQHTDDFKNQLFRSVGVSLFRIRTGEDYNQKIDEFINTLH